jgi:hypothetical protein
MHRLPLQQPSGHEVESQPLHAWLTHGWPGSHTAHGSPSIPHAPASSPERQTPFWQQPAQPAQAMPPSTAETAPSVTTTSVSRPSTTVTVASPRATMLERERPFTLTVTVLPATSSSSSRRVVCGSVRASFGTSGSTTVFDTMLTENSS